MGRDFGSGKEVSVALTGSGGKVTGSVKLRLQYESLLSKEYMAEMEVGLTL